MKVFFRKARRKEREGEPTGDPKLYLQEALLERKLPELDMRQLVDLPLGLDYNEWLASHSESRTILSIHSRLTNSKDLLLFFSNG